MLLKKTLFLLVAVGCLLKVELVFAECLGGATTTGFCWPTENDALLLGWHGYNPDFSSSGVHLAQDIRATEDEDVYAIADGEVLYNRMDVSCFGGFTVSKTCIDGGALIIKHRNSNGNFFTAQYGHVKNITKNTTVRKGQKIAEIGPYKNGIVHLHFAIRYPFNDDDNRWAGYGITDKGFVDPVTFITTHAPGKMPTPYRMVTDSNAYGKSVYLFWTPHNVSCINAQKWCYNSRCSKDFTSAICYNVYDELRTINQLKYILPDWQDTFFGAGYLDDSNAQCEP